MRINKIKRICMFTIHGDPLGVLGTPDIGGQCVYVKELSKALARLRSDIKVYIYTRLYGNKPKEELISEQVKVIRLPCGPDGFVRKEDLGEYLPQFINNTLKYIELNELKYDIIHSHYWDGGIVGVAVSKDLGIPLIHTNHSLGKLKQEVLPSEANSRYTERIRREKEIMKTSSKVIAESSLEKGEIERLYEIDKSNIDIVPAGVNIDWFKPFGNSKDSKKRLALNVDLLVLALGRMDPRKGFEYLIKAAPSVVKEVETRGKSVFFLISGGSEEAEGPAESKEKQKLKELAHNLRVEHYVKIVPRFPVQMVPTYYTTADVLVVPSLYEPFGLVIVEAMACGTPVIATNRGGPVDIIEDGTDGFLVDPENVKLLSSRICTILLNVDLRNQMILRALKKAREKYSWLRIANKMYEVYSSI